SSRRRHTRSKRDWSSDVCSSDLIQGVGAVQDAKVRGGTGGLAELMQQWSRKAFDTVMTQVGRADLEGRDPQAPPPFLGQVGDERSEERRVGKECGWGSGTKCDVG